MNQEIYRSKYVVISFDQDTRFFFTTYLPETKFMSNKEWEDVMLHIVSVTKECKPKYIIDDNRDRNFAYSPDIQEWTLNLFVKCWNEVGVEKYVQILPKNIIGKISAEQIEEMANKQFSFLFKNKFVADYESALKWINE